MIAHASLSAAFHRERDCTNKSKQSGAKELRAFSPAETSRKARLRLLRQTTFDLVLLLCCRS
jgi:hypothetical protein